MDIHDDILASVRMVYGGLRNLLMDEMQKLIVELWHETQATVFAVTHSISEAVYLGDRVWIITKAPGQIAFDIRDCIPPSVGEDPLAIQDSPEFKKAVEVVGDSFRRVMNGR
ncbi:MAG: hypothetical protein AAB344_00810 [Bacteroidota bacterium]